MNSMEDGPAKSTVVTGQPADAEVIVREDVLERVAREMGIRRNWARKAVELLLAGATIPFIARYRKELTGSLDEVKLAEISDRYQALVELEDRRAFILNTIHEQGKLSPQLRAQLEAAGDLGTLEDLYLPYKPRKRTRAQKAREEGLEPLADAVAAGDDARLAQVLTQLSAELHLSSEVALAKARDILAERMSEDARIREHLRNHLRKTGEVIAHTGKHEDVEGHYRSLLGVRPTVSQIQGHRVLALNRAVSEGVLRYNIDAENKGPRAFALERLARGAGPRCAEHLASAVDDGYDRLLLPSIENEIKRELTEKAEDEAIEVFAVNLRKLLLAPPLGERAVIGIDPGFRTGCKVALVDRHGDLVTHCTVFPHPPQSQIEEAVTTMLAMIEQFKGDTQVEYCAFGNGTASRETAKFLRVLEERIRAGGGVLHAIQVSESGASVYSASAIAREEFPELDLTVRGAISIARRLQDPLAELIKVDPKAIGVGQYQHDVDQKKLAKTLSRVVESCVNQVGVDLNTASWMLLTYVSGLSQRLAKSILKHRAKIGGFKDRKELLKVPGLGPKIFEQCAGFLRILQGDNILDATAVHPERYEVVGEICRLAGMSLPELVQNPERVRAIDPATLVNEHKGIGLPTVEDILEELQRPGRDPRGAFEVFEYAEGIETIDDLKPGMVLPGVVTNVTKFGCFVDIGVHQDGLVHISELSRDFVKEPSDVISVGQKVRVKVLAVEAKRNRIGLSIKRADE